MKFSNYSNREKNFGKHSNIGKNAVATILAFCNEISPDGSPSIDTILLKAEMSEKGLNNNIALDPNARGKYDWRKFNIILIKNLLNNSIIYI